MANSEISNGHNYGLALFMSIEQTAWMRHSAILRKRLELRASSLIQRTFYLAINSKLMRSKFVHHSSIMILFMNERMRWCSIWNPISALFGASIKAKSEAIRFDSFSFE